MTSNESAMKTPDLQAEQHATRILKAVLDGNQELHGIATVDDAVIVGQRQIHHGADLDLAVDRHRTILNLVHTQNGALWGIYNGRREQRAEDATVGNGEGAARDVL